MLENIIYKLRFLPIINDIVKIQKINSKMIF